MSSPEKPELPCGCRTRRSVLTLILSAAAIANWPGRAEPAGGNRLVLVHTHTGEVLDTVYRTQAGYRPGELGRLDWLLRDFRSGDVLPLEARLFDLLSSLAQAAGVEPRYQIISAYRSPATNAMLAATSDGVSSKSLHMEGKAMDVRMGGVELSNLRAAALSLGRGGVGYYPQDNFVHVDTGRVRRWG